MTNYNPGPSSTQTSLTAPALVPAGSATVANPIYQQAAGSLLGTRLTTVITGDSIPLNNGVLPTLDSRSFVSWANCLAGSPFEIIGNVGVNGATSAQVLATIPSVIALSPSHCDLMCGTDDLGILSISQTLNNMTQIFQQLNAAGIYVRAYAVLPRALSAALMGQVNQMNAFIRDYWRNSSSGEFIDSYSALINPTSTSQAMVAGASADAVHPTPYGAYLIGLNAVPAFQRWGAPSVLPSSATEDASIVTGGAVLSVHPLFDGAGGAAINGSTGTVGTGWTATCGSATQVCSLIANAGGFGQSQHLVMTSSGAGQTCNLVSASTIQGFQKGTKYFAVAEIIIAANPTNLSGVDLFMTDLNVSKTGNVLQPNVTNQAITITSQTKLICRTPLLTWSGGSAGGSLQMQAAFAGAGGATIDVGRMAIYARPF